MHRKCFQNFKFYHFILLLEILRLKHGMFFFKADIFTQLTCLYFFSKKRDIMHFLYNIGSCCPYSASYQCNNCYLNKILVNRSKQSRWQTIAGNGYIALFQFFSFQKSIVMISWTCYLFFSISCYCSFFLCNETTANIDLYMYSCCICHSISILMFTGMID